MSRQRWLGARHRHSFHYWFSPDAIPRLLLLSGLMLLSSACTQRLAATALAPARALTETAAPVATEPVTFSPLSLPTVETRQLDNRIRITLLPSTRAPYIQIQLLVDAGRLLNGAEADVLAEMLRLIGSADSESAWQQQWRELGASLSARSGSHRLIFSAEVLPPQADALFARLQHMWQQPNLMDAATLERAKRNLRTDQRESDLLGGDALRLWRRLAYGAQHPYGRTIAERSQLQAVSLESLRTAWQRAQTEPQHWLIAGAVMDTELTHWLTPLQQQAPVNSSAHWRTLTPTLPAPAAIPTVHLLNAPDAAQVNLMLGYALPLREPAARWTCEALASLLGNSSGRLYRDLRERRGLSYDPAAYCSGAPFASELVLRASTRPEHASAMLHGMLGHLQLLRTQPADATEMQWLRQHLRGSTRMQLETARQRSARFNIQDWLGESWQDLVSQDQFWQALTAAQLQQFAEQGLPGEPVIVLRGDADALAAQLRTMLPTTTVTIHRDADAD